MLHQRAELPLTLDGLDAARTFFGGCLADANPRQEHLFVAHLDDKSRCVHLSRYAGDEGSADFPLRDIIVDAATHGSAAIVLAHNHPSGDSRPSDSDMRATRKLAAAAEALDCAVLDHLVFGGRDVSSLRQMGYL